jgi:DNA-binding response OmpR family regulator
VSVSTVLLVDDEPDILLVLRLGFEDEGHQVVMAADGRMALDRLSERPADVVVLDLMMPVVDGWGVLEGVREQGLQTPVIVVSAKSDPNDCKKALERGAVEYVVKPFDLDRLISLVNTILDEDDDTRAARRQAGIDALT